MSRALDWDTESAGWPHREHSRLIEANGMRWHVQVMGQGPPLLLLHGTGASAHSWRGVAGLLKDRFTVIAPDLPGHGFSDVPHLDGLRLPAMARGLAALTKALGLAPQVGAGHSAGAAILIRLALDMALPLKTIVSFNGALFPFGGMAGAIFSPLAKLLVWNPLVPRVFAMSADDKSVRRLLNDTGSRLDDEGLALYRRLMRNHGHVSGALGMMASWDLVPIETGLKRLAADLILVKALNDRTIKPAAAGRAAALCPHARVIELPRLGHLAHEEDPAGAAAIIAGAALAKTAASRMAC